MTTNSSLTQNKTKDVQKSIKRSRTSVMKQQPRVQNHFTWSPLCLKSQQKNLQNVRKEAHAGLWKICVKQRTGLQVCGPFESMTKVSPPQASRALIVISCILGILSLLLLFFGSDFTPCVQNQDTKTKMILAAAVGLMLTGLLVIIPLNWETNAQVEGVRMGACIYIGYLTGLTLILTGVLLCCFGRPGSSSLGGIVSCLSNRV
ncbi:claudin-9-like isoform X1 [Xiphophorus hellerii]|uniref:claudin-9-like isoform X1 n=1 Tax=Xiphophorus hellerii TaxID=8084 RepID=UPI0013B40F69|nr:claudin-9-like isoform X1 [Xiphophorus hellerii]